MSQLFNMPSSLVITFLPKSKHLLISWLFIIGLFSLSISSGVSFNSLCLSRNLFHPIHLIYWNTIVFISIWSEVRSDDLCLLIRLNLFIFYDTIDIFGFISDILLHFLYVLFIPLFLL